MDQEDQVPPRQLETELEEMSLEYQLSNINQAKSFSRYLNAIECFYTDKPVDFEMLSTLTPEQTAVFAPMEHERWVREHQSMGWRAGDDYETLPLDADGQADGLSPKDEKVRRAALREQLRCHKLAMDEGCTGEEIFRHYESLPEEEQSKDWKPFNCMLKLIRKFDGLRIYRLE